MIYNPLSFEDQQDVYTLRYEAYVASASITANDQQQFIDDYDYQPNCRSHIEYINGQAAGSIRACLYDKNDPLFKIPAQELFPEELDRHVGADCSMVESNKFVVHPVFQGKSIALKFKLLKFVFDRALEADARYIVTSPRATQLEFYEKILFKKISGIKKSLALDFDVALMICDLHEARKIVKQDPKFKLLKRMGLC